MTIKENKPEVETIEVEREEYDYLQRRNEKLEKIEEEGNPADIDLVEAHQETTNL